MSKRPTDTQIVRGFQKFEEGMNVAMAIFRDHPEIRYPLNMQEAIIAQDKLFAAHGEYRVLAYEAQMRIDAKKGNDDA